MSAWVGACLRDCVYVRVFVSVRAGVCPLDRCMQSCMRACILKSIMVFKRNVQRLSLANGLFDRTLQHLNYLYL